jgi:S-adenosylmethionine uptake transporter
MTACVMIAVMSFFYAGFTYFSAKAYSLAEASIIAPMEYVTVPFAVLWGILIWSETPSLIDVLGMSLIVSAGVIILMERRKKSSTT